jgi:RNA polymerase sigma factor (sigma-70 family)
MELAQLVTAAQSGDLDAFGQVVGRFQKMACALAYSAIGDQHLAEDAAQEAFIEAYLYLPKLREPAAFPGWFRRIVLKRADRLTRGKHPASVSLDHAEQLACERQDPPALAEARELQGLVQRAITALPEIDRQMVSLFYFAGYSQAEIATITELPVTTVKKRLYDARLRLRRELDDLDLVVQEQLHRQRTEPADDFARAVQFFIAVRTGDLPRVRAYLLEDPSLLNTHERWDEATARQYGIPPAGAFAALHRAIFNCDQVLTAFLLEQGADPNAQTRSGHTPLHIAVLYNHPEAIAPLLAARADPNIATNCGMTPLHWAVLRRRHTMIEPLLAAGADDEAADIYGRTPREWARLKGQKNQEPRTTESRNCGTDHHLQNRSAQ